MKPKNARKTTPHRTIPLVITFALLSALGACSSSPEPNKITVNGEEIHDENDVVVTPATRDVQLDVGQRLVIDFGTYNTSVGDEYEVVQEPDATVLANFTRESKYLGEDDEDGAPSTLFYWAKAAAPGTTEIQIDYYYRGDKSDQRSDVRLQVEVVEP